MQVAGRTALALLWVVCAALAIAFAAPASRVVLATAGGSPDWLLGPWRALGWNGADGDAAGPLFYVGLWLALLLYVGVLAGARGIGPRLAIGSIAGLHALFLLAPPLLSQDVFSYISYARLDVLHGLGPYTHSPDAVPSDAAFGFAGSKDASSVYGPLFTLITLPLAKLPVATAFWALKAMAALCSLGVVALTWACAVRLGRDPVMPALAVGLNPLVLVHVVGGAHNDALVVLLWMAAALALLDAQTRAGPRDPHRQRGEPLAGLLSACAAAVKVSGGLIGPFLLTGARRRWALVVGGVAGLAIALGAGLIAFGTSAGEAFVRLGQNQDRTSRWSIPQRAADGLSAVTSISPGTAVDVTRTVFAVLFVVALVLLLRRAWALRERPGGWIGPAGWATLGLLVASAWLVPWYVIWLLPLAALSADGRLLPASIALSAYMLVIAVPL
jgi:alpha-1,6-mannosyltransferase